MALPIIEVSGGELTALRTLAAATWGSYDVAWPEDNAPDPIEQEGRRDGYVSMLPVAQQRRVGGFCRRFVRADLTVSAKDGFSTVEEDLDLAAERTQGEVFFERDLTQTELGRLVPGKHFDVGDRLRVRVRGHVLSLPVTSIRTEVTQANPVGVITHVGGQVVSDDDARRAANDDLERVLRQERRERAKETGEAISTARTAAATATTAYSFAVNSRDQAGQAVLEARQATEVAAQADLTSEEGKQTAIQALTTAASANTTAIQANSTAITANSNSVQALNRAQAADEEFKKQQVQINDQQRQINANQLWVNSMVARPLGAAAGYSDEDDYARLVVTSTNVEFASKKRWHGRVYLLVSFEALNNYTKVYAEPIRSDRPSFSMSSQAFQGVRDVFCMYKVFGEY